MRIDYSIYSTEEREEITRAVLDTPVEVAARAIGEKLSLKRETVRRIRVGLMWADVLPEIPRITTEQMALRCDQCLHWIEQPYRERDEDSDIRRTGRCSLGIPEACSVLFARGCGAFTQVPEAK